MATYEIVLDRTAEDSAVDVVEDLPPAKGGEVLFRRSTLIRVTFGGSTRSSRLSPGRRMDD